MPNKIERYHSVTSPIAVPTDINDCPPIPYGAVAGGMVLVDENTTPVTEVSWYTKAGAEDAWATVRKSDGTQLTSTGLDDSTPFAFPIPDDLFGAKFIGLSAADTGLTVRLMLKG